MKPYRFHREAEAEFLEAVRHYSEKRSDCIFIVAVSPFKREPGYWRERLR